MSSNIRFVVYDSEFESAFLDSSVPAHPVFTKGRARMVQTVSDWRSRLASARKLEVFQYLDHFDVVIPDDPAAFPPLTQLLFDFVASDYESWIDPERNRENIQTLLRIIRDLKPDAKRLLDFGCGNGLAFDLVRDRGMILVGFDQSSAMRESASNRGMEVWGSTELETQPAESLDAAFASYVFDVIPSAQHLSWAWKSIRPSGLFVGNFHKNRGQQHVSEVLMRLGAQLVPVPDPSAERHGPYLAFVKRGDE